MKEKLKLYVGFTASHSPQSFRDEVNVLKEKLAEEYNVIALSIALTPDAYERDIECAIGQCDIFVVICDYSATTLGLQIAASVWLYKKLTLVCAHTDMSVAPLLVSMDTRLPHYGFYRYDNLISDVPKILEKLVQKTF